MAASAGLLTLASSSTPMPSAVTGSWSRFSIRLVAQVDVLALQLAVGRLRPRGRG